MTALPIATLFPGHECMDDLTTECSPDSQAMWVIDVLGLFLDMLYIGVCDALGLGGGVCRVLQFPPLVTTNKLDSIWQKKRRNLF